MNKPIAVIPARGGSKRVKNKNITKINGKSLIEYAIDVCKESELFSEIYVNSDDDSILEVTETFGAKGYKRPAEYATDTAYVIDAIKEMINTLNLDPCDVGILLPTSPLRLSTDLINAWNIYVEVKNAVVSVCKYETPIQLAHFLNDNGRMQPFFPKDYSKTTRSIGHSDAYRFNGAIIFNNTKSLLMQSNLIGAAPYPYVMPEERSIDIDHLYQLEVIKLILDKKEA